LRIRTKSLGIRTDSSSIRPKP